MINNSMNNICLYFHIPFCAHKCPYCGFFSKSGKENLWKKYFETLTAEIITYKPILKKSIIDTVYIGGGTPSLVPAIYLSNLIKDLKANFKLSKNVEITLEANPESLTLSKLKKYKNAEINRLSLGVQTTNSQILARIGRQYDWQKVQKVFKNARKIGFANINLDLIFGLPGSDLEIWQKDLEKILSLNPDHIACYSLELDEKSAWGRLDALGKFEVIDEGLNRQMYHIARKILKIAGYQHYEISNWAKKGHECKHNLNFWHHKPYIGIGAGAHSFWQNKRWSNIENIEYYINNIKRQDKISINKLSLTKLEHKNEKLMLGLRLIGGISLTDFDAKTADKIIQKYKDDQKGLFKIVNNNLKLTSKGLDFENEAVKYLIS